MALKRGAKLFLSCEGRAFVGPFKWTLVREWVALGLVGHDALVKTDEGGEPVVVGMIEQLLVFSQGLCDTAAYYRSSGRTRFPSAPRQHSYLRSLGCPFETAHLDKHLTWRVISDLEQAFPDRAVASERDACEEELERIFREAPATDRQREYLSSIGVEVSEDLSKAEASQMIGGPPTDGQLRRLRFYQIPLPRFLTKNEASDLIDHYIREHPESEAKYQAWKQQAIEREVAPPVLRDADSTAGTKKSWWKLW
jgi:hypothetical protein